MQYGETTNGSLCEGFPDRLYEKIILKTGAMVHVCEVAPSDEKQKTGSGSGPGENSSL
jgi:hypothetical protein